MIKHENHFGEDLAELIQDLQPMQTSSIFGRVFSVGDNFAEFVRSAAEFDVRMFSFASAHFVVFFV